jgi:hypothetical protein
LYLKVLKARKPLILSEFTVEAGYRYKEFKGKDNQGYSLEVANKGILVGNA